MLPAMDRPLGLILGTLPPLAVERFRALDALAEFVPYDDATAEQRRTAELLFVWNFRSKALDGIVAGMPALRWLHAASAGVEHVIVPSVVESDIVVTNAAGLFDPAMAEFVIALVLAHAKGLIGFDRAQQAHHWAYREADMVAGATLVIAGMGSIGTEVARAARKLDMRVIGVRRSGQAYPDDPAGVTVTADLAAVAPEADYLVVTAALTPATRGLVHRGIVEALRPSAYLINVARAPIVDTDAVVDALRSGRLAGAALDVFEAEPLPADSPLWDVPNLLITPHMAGDTVDFTGAIVDLFGENVGRWRRDVPLEKQIDTALGY